MTLRRPRKHFKDDRMLPAIGVTTGAGYAALYAAYLLLQIAGIR